MRLCDFHIHSTYSDGKHSISEIVDFYGKRNFDCIAITDHLCETNSLLGRGAHYLNRTLTQSTFSRYLLEIKSEAKRAQEEYGMILLPGYEVTKNYLSNQRSAHFIGIGVTRLLNPNDSIENSLLDLKDQGALTIAAHPVSNGTFEKQTLHLWDQRENLRHLFDAWEVGSGVHYFNEVAGSGLPLIASSDLHHFGQIQSWKTLVDAPLEAHAILSSVREQKIEFHFYRQSEVTHPKIEFSRPRPCHP